MFRKVKRYWYNIVHPVIGEVWQLHRVTDDVSKDKTHQIYEITPYRLESLIVQYQHLGYEFIPIDDVPTRMGRNTNNKRRFVAITLDDGYLDNFTNAFPIFKKYNVPFCIYVCQQFVEGKIMLSQEQKLYRFLSVEQLRQLAIDPLCTLGGHTKNHTRLTILSKEEQTKEIKTCIQWLEDVTAKRITSYAYPYGSYNEDSLSIMRLLNLKSAVASWGGMVRKNSLEKTYSIPRVLVTNNYIQ